jgi:hypothetical protein
MSFTKIIFSPLVQKIKIIILINKIILFGRIIVGGKHASDYE